MDVRSASRTFVALGVVLSWAPSVSAQMPFRYAEDTEPSTLNPMFSSKMVDVRLEELLFEGLFTYDHLLRPVPALAEKCSGQKDDCVHGPSRFAQVTLRKATWHDGQPVTAADVEFTVKVLQDARTASPAGGTAGCIDKIQVTGPLDLTIGFKRDQMNPSQCLMFKILPKHKFPATLPIPRSHEFRARPVGSGPYKMDKWQSKKLDLVRTDETVGLPRVQAMFVPDKKIQLEFLQYDSLEAIVRIQPNQRAEVEGLGSDKVEVVPYANLSWWYLGVNHNNPQLADKLVRQAIVHAINRDDLRKTFLGEGVTISGPFAPRTPYYDDRVLPYPFDLEESERLLKQAGYQRAGKGQPYSKGGVKLRFRLAVDKGAMGHYKDVYLLLQTRLKDAGIDIDLDPMESVAFKEKVMNRRDFDLTISIWSFDDSFDVYPLFHSKGRENYVGYSSAAMDDLLEKTRQTTSPELYQSYFRQVHRLSHADLPYIFLWSVPSYAAVTSRVANVDLHPFRFFTWIREWKWRE